MFRLDVYKYVCLWNQIEVFAVLPTYKNIKEAQIYDLRKLATFQSIKLNWIWVSSKIYTYLKVCNVKPTNKLSKLQKVYNVSCQSKMFQYLFSTRLKLALNQV